MKNSARKVAILAGKRTPFVRSFQQYLGIQSGDLMTGAFDALVEKCGLQNVLLGDVALGSVMLRSSDWGLTRETVLRSKLHPHTPGYNVQRACGTGLEAANQLALKISSGQIDSGIAGGVDTNSDIPVLLPRSFSKKLLELRAQKSIWGQISHGLAFGLTDLKPEIPGVVEPRTGLSMGEHTENMVKEWKITREEQDQWAYESHQKAARATAQNGAHQWALGLIAPFAGLEKDTILRADTTIEKLAKLKPVFDRSAAGTLTAGNSSALSDGASAILLGSEEFANQHKLEPLAYFVDGQVAAVNFVAGEGLLMAPTIAVAQLLKRNNLTLQDFDFYEIHEAFAGQVLCTLKAWQDEAYCRKFLGGPPLGAIDRQKINVTGSSLAYGHPFAATGARLVATLSHLLREKGHGRGLISICTAGGMGVAAILER